MHITLLLDRLHQQLVVSGQLVVVVDPRLLLGPKLPRRLAPRAAVPYVSYRLGRHSILASDLRAVALGTGLPLAVVGAGGPHGVDLAGSLSGEDDLAGEVGLVPLAAFILSIFMLRRRTSKSFFVRILVNPVVNSDAENKTSCLPWICPDKDVIAVI